MDCIHVLLHDFKTSFFFRSHPDILFHSVAGSMLSNILHSVLLINDEVLQSTSSLLMDLLKPLDKFNKHLPLPLEANSRKCTLSSHSGRARYNDIQMSIFYPIESESVFVSPFLDYEPWTWIIDCEQICSLLLGRCIYNRMMGDVVYTEVNKWKHWLKSDLFYEALVNKVSSTKGSQMILMRKLTTKHSCYLLNEQNLSSFCDQVRRKRPYV